MNLKSDFLVEAIERGFFYQATNLEGMDNYLSSGSRYAYLGMDVTAKSLHVGHLIPIFLIRLFKKHGHKPIILVGGGTTKVGDPSFKNTARPILTDEQINENLVGIKSCLYSILSLEEENDDIKLLNNADWLDKLNYIELLRDIGKYFSVNRMIGFESVKAKLSENNTLSFLEFNYMIMQAYDFYKLFENLDCRIQLGGQDQWGNIVCGVELIRKKLEKEVFGFTVPLLTTSDGKKMGKTANGAVWLSKDMLSPYDFWQYWRNIDDADVAKCLRLFTDLPIEEIKKLEALHDKEINEAKKVLANEVTAIVHGRKALDDVLVAVSGMFDGGNVDDSKVPSITCDFDDFSIIDTMVKFGVCVSKGEAKRLLRGNGVIIDGKVVNENYKPISKDTFKVTIGKKKHFLVKFHSDL